MLTIRFLKALFEPGPLADQRAEYRLACSGELYRAHVLTSDWRKSDVTRLLLVDPLELLVASQPFDSYPQELCLRLPVTTETRTSGNSTAIITTDAHVVDDLCSLLTLFLRRLIKPLAKTSHDLGGEWAEKHPSPLNRRPMPILGHTIVAWRPRPLSLLIGIDGLKARFHNPPPVAVDSDRLTEALRILGSERFGLAPAFLRAANLYALGLELIEDRPALAYQMFITAVEAVAAASRADWTPTYDEMVARFGSLVAEANAQRLDPVAVEKIVRAAASNEHWVTKKFVGFLKEHATEDMWTHDSVFPFLSADHLPKAEQFEGALKRVYRARSQATHTGEPFSGMACAGATSSIPVEALIPDGKDVPPVTWFERVVSSALNRWFASSSGLSGSICAAVEPASEPDWQALEVERSEG